MENLTNILCALQTILPTQLLAPSWNVLAAKLGTARSIFYRIMAGEVRESAMQNLLSLLNSRLKVDVPALMRMEAAISNEKEFTKLIKSETSLNDADWQYTVILSFISHDYTKLSAQFRNGILNQILLLERSDPRAFFNMLAYFYIRTYDIKFYKSNKTYKECCSAVIEPLGIRLAADFPSNGFGAGISYTYSKTDAVDRESHTLWALVERISSMLQAFASPINLTESNCNYRLLQGLSHRSFWKGENSENIFLLWLRPGREPATGHYELFSINPNNGALKGIASLFLLSDDTLSVYIKSSGSSQLGHYRWEEDSLCFEWKNPNDDPIQTGNKLFLKSVQNSQSIRELDRFLTDDALIREMARSEGCDYDFALQPTDVMLSRHLLTIILKDGSRYSINLDFAPFLRKLTPNESLMVVRQISDNRLFVIWPQIRQSIPLDEFNTV